MNNPEQQHYKLVYEIAKKVLAEYMAQHQGGVVKTSSVATTPTPQERVAAMHKALDTKYRSYISRKLTPSLSKT